MIVVPTGEWLLLAFAVWVLLWEVYEIARERHRRAAKRHIG